MRQPTIAELIKPAEAEKLRIELAKSLVFVGELRDRLNRQVPHHEPLRVHLCRAYEELHAIGVLLHYLSCESGVANGPRYGSEQV